VLRRASFFKDSYYYYSEPINFMYDANHPVQMYIPEFLRGVGGFIGFDKTFNTLRPT
jgi:hypothetical protein